MTLSEDLIKQCLFEPYRAINQCHLPTSHKTNLNTHAGKQVRIHVKLRCNAFTKARRKIIKTYTQTHTPSSLQDTLRKCVKAFIFMPETRTFFAE